MGKGWEREDNSGCGYESISIGVIIRSGGGGVGNWVEKTERGEG